MEMIAISGILHRRGNTARYIVTFSYCVKRLLRSYVGVDGEERGAESGGLSLMYKVGL